MEDKVEYKNINLFKEGVKKIKVGDMCVEYVYSNSEKKLFDCIIKIFERKI